MMVDQGEAFQRIIIRFPFFFHSQCDLCEQLDAVLSSSSVCDTLGGLICDRRKKPLQENRGPKCERVELQSFYGALP